MNDTINDEYQVTITSVASSIPMILVALAAFLENSLVLLAVSRSRTLRQLPGNVFIVNLAITDVMGSSLCMPFGFVTVMLRGRYIFGHALCQAQAFLIVTLSNVTFLTLLGYSIFRYIMITSLRQLTISTLWKGVKIYLASIWTLGVLFAALPIVGWGRYCYFESFYSCTVDWVADKSYSTTLFIVIFFIPQTIMIASYYRISTFVRRHKKQLNKCRRVNHADNWNSSIINASEVNHGFSNEISNGPSFIRGIKRSYDTTPKVLYVKSLESNHHTNTTEKSKHSSQASVKDIPDTTPKVEGNKTEMKTPKVCGKGKTATNLLRVVQQERLVKILLFTVLAFYLCWLPFAAASFQQVIGHGKPRPQYYDVISMWLAFSNALCNPVIYGLLNGQFRKAFRDTMKSLCSCCFRK